MQNIQIVASSRQLLDAQSTPSQLHPKKRRKQGGFSLPELALVILIGSLLAGVAALILPGIFANFRANKVIDEFNISIPAMQTAYQNRTSFAGLTTAQVAQNGWVGSSFVEMTNGVPTGNLVTQWGTLTLPR